MKKTCLSFSLLTLMAAVACESNQHDCLAAEYTSARSDAPVSISDARRVLQLDAILTTLESAPADQSTIFQSERLAIKYSTYKQLARSDRAWAHALNLAEQLRDTAAISIVLSGWADEIALNDFARGEKMKRQSVSVFGPVGNLSGAKEKAYKSLIDFYERFGRNELAAVTRQELNSHQAQIVPRPPCYNCGLG